MRLSAFESRAENDAKPMRRDLFVFHSDPGVGADQSGERDLQAGLFFDFTRRARLKSLPEFQVAAGQVPESERFLLPLLHEQHAVSVADGHAHEDFDDLLIHLILKLENADVAEPRLARGAPRALAAVNLQPDVSFARVTLAVVLKSVIFTSLSQAVTCAGWPSILARSLFHAFFLKYFSQSLFCWINPPSAGA